MPPLDRYLELQIHGEILFGRDVDTLVVDEEEVNPKTRPWLDTFATKFGCKVMMFKDGNMVPFEFSKNKKKSSDLPETIATPSGKFRHSFTYSGPCLYATFFFADINTHGTNIMH